MHDVTFLSAPFIIQCTSVFSKFASQLLCKYGLMEPKVSYVLLNVKKKMLMLLRKLG